MSSSLRVASWNVNSIRARMDRLLDWVDAAEPDVLCLQETMVGDTRFPTEPFETRGFGVVAHGRGGRGGVAIVSRPELTDVVRGFPNAAAPFDEPRSISVTVEGIRLHTVYAPNGRKVGTPPHQVKLAWFELLGRWLEIDGLGEQPTLLVGDLNIAPLDIDIWAPERYRKRNLSSPKEREAFEVLLDRGLVDAIRRQFGDQHVYTWWNRRSDFYETDRGWRLDHVLADAATAERIDRIEVDRVERGRPSSSDHAPIVVDLAHR